MTDFRILIAFAALCAVALFYVSLGVKGAFAPFCAACTAIVWFSLMGTVGLLRVGGWLFYLAAAAAVVWLILRHGQGKKPLAAPGFGFWFFVGAGLALMLLLYIRQPLFLYWDEFSFWGAAGKLTKLTDTLFPVAEIGWAAPSTQKPGLVVFSYFFQFFGSGFSEWQTYAASDVFMVAGLATVLGAFDKNKHWNAALPLMLVLFLVPFAFRHGIPTQIVSTVYMDSTAELPLGCAFGATLAMWFGGERGRLRGMGPVCLGLACLVLLKDAALMFALVAAVLVACDYLCTPQDNRPKLRGRLGGAAARLGLGLFCVAAVFLLWDAYAASVIGTSRLEDVGGTAQTGMLQMPLLFIQDLLRPEKSEIFTTVTSGMVQYFFMRNNMFGSGFTAMLGMLGILGATALFLCPKRSALRRQCIVFGIFSTLGFAAYYLFLTLSYLYILSPIEARRLASYDRYVYPFYMGLFLVVLFLACQGLAAAKRRPAAAGKAVLVLLAAGLLVRTWQFVPLQYSVLGVPQEEYSERLEFNRNVAHLKSRLDPDGKTFIVTSQDEGMRLYMYVHEMLPLRTDYSYGGGGRLRVKKPGPDGTSQVVEVTLAEFEEYLAESGCTTLYFDSINAIFIENYGSLFSDGLQGAAEGRTLLYSISVQDGHVWMEPVLDG